MQRALILIGAAIVIVGILWPWLIKLPLGRLPGDLIIDKLGLKLFFPLTTMIIISVIISILLWLFRR